MHGEGGVEFAEAVIFHHRLALRSEKQSDIFLRHTGIRTAVDHGHGIDNRLAGEIAVFGVDDALLIIGSLRRIAEIDLAPAGR